MLIVLIAIPFLGATALAMMNPSKTRQAWEPLAQQDKTLLRTALVITMFTFIVSLIMWGEFDDGLANAYVGQFTVNSMLEQGTWLYRFPHVGLDGLSLYYVLLTTFTMPLAILASWQSISLRGYLKEYLALLLLLESLLIGVFIVSDLLMFYVFFEAVLIPLFIIVGIWGASAARVRASYLLFLYTLFGSLFMLLAFIVIWYNVGSTDMNIINASLSSGDVAFSLPSQQLLFGAIFLSLAIKTPLVPFHIWLSRAHVEAPLAGSIILAGLILKLATYGFLRVLIPYLPEACTHFSPLVQMIGVITLVYSSLSTIRQSDFKNLVAYSSVAHMAVGTVALFSNTIQGIAGAILLSIAHGFVSPALFIAVGGVLYDRYHTRAIRFYRGLGQMMPLWAFFFFLFTLANMATPGSLNWVGELMSLMGTFIMNPLTGLFMSTGIVLSACYSIWLMGRLTFGGPSLYLSYSPDVSKRESHIFLALLIPTVFFGLWPNTILVDLHSSTSSLLYNSDFNIAFIPFLAISRRDTFL